MNVSYNGGVNQGNVSMTYNLVSARLPSKWMCEVTVETVFVFVFILGNCRPWSKSFSILGCFYFSLFFSLTFYPLLMPLSNFNPHKMVNRLEKCWLTHSLNRHETLQLHSRCCDRFSFPFLCGLRVVVSSISALLDCVFIEDPPLCSP